MKSLRSKSILSILTGGLLVLHSGAFAGGGYSIPWRSVQLVADNEATLWIESSPIDHKLERVLFSSGDHACSIPSELMDGIHSVAPHEARLNFSSSIPLNEDEEMISLVEIVIPIFDLETPRFANDFNAVEFLISGNSGCDISVEFFEYKNNSRGAQITRAEALGE